MYMGFSYIYIYIYMQGASEHARRFEDLDHVRCFFGTPAREHVRSCDIFSRRPPVVAILVYERKLRLFEAQNMFW